MRSMALCRAVWMIQARGTSGMPEMRHWSTAAAKASCAASSAISKSPVSRIKVATIRPQSERYTSSTAVSESWGMPDCKNFSAWCRFGKPTFDLLMEAHKHMKYMLLIYDEEQAWAKLSETEQRQIMGDYRKFSQEIRESGHY